MPGAVLDTNVLVAWRRGQFGLVTSHQQRDELLHVLHRPKFRAVYGVTPADIARFARRIDQHATFIRPVMPVPVVVRDPKDEAILAISLEGAADYLVSGDKDLLVLASDPRLGTLQIVTPRGSSTSLGTGRGASRW